MKVNVIFKKQLRTKLANEHSVLHKIHMLDNTHDVPF